MNSAHIPPHMRPMTLLDGLSSHPRKASAIHSLAIRIAHLVAKWRRSDVQQVPSMLALPERTATSVVVKEPPLVFECTEGLIWVTHDAGSGDHILVSGQRFVASARARVVVYAFAPSRVSLLSERDVRRETRTDEEESRCLSHE